MFTFMDYVQNAFYEAIGWNRDNSYSNLTASAESLLAFETPRGLHLDVSSLASPNFATSYTLNNLEAVNGSVSYLHSSAPLAISHRSTEIDLHNLVCGYRHLPQPFLPRKRGQWDDPQPGIVGRRDTLLFGRLFLPQNSLEALYLRRLSSTRFLRVAAISDGTIPNGGSILALLQNDHGRYSTEYLYSTDSALLGVRGLYNFGSEIENQSDGKSTGAPSLFSAGAELYYGILNKSGGLSTGARFTTLAPHSGLPYTMTLTLNPLMGNLSSTYAVKAGGNLALCSRFDFNVYSYESGVVIGLELWRRRRASDDLAWARRVMAEHEFTSSGDAAEKTTLSKYARQEDANVAGVLKAKVDHNWRIGLLWEGRFKELLFSVGTSLDLKRREEIFRGIGLEIQYSS